MRLAISVTALVALIGATMVAPASGEVLDRSVRESADAEARVVKPRKLSYTVGSAPEAPVRVRVVLNCFSAGRRVSRYEKTLYAAGSVGKRLPLSKANDLCVFRVSGVPWIFEDLPVTISVTLMGTVERDARGGMTP